MAEQGTHKPLVVSSNLTLGTVTDDEGLFIIIWWSLAKEIAMSVLKTQDQGIITLSQQDYLPILIESFLIDRRSQGLSPDTIDFYTKKLKYFLKYCEGQALTQLSQITTDLIRRYILELSETHNPGGVHACFRPLRTLLYWVEDEEIMPQDWKNPIPFIAGPRSGFR